MVSDGVTVDFTAPSPGVVVIGQDDSTGYISSGDTIYAHWSGFKDTVSGIISYQFALCEMKNRSRCAMEFTSIGLQTNITLSGRYIFKFVIACLNWLGYRLTCFRVPHRYFKNKIWQKYKTAC
jgi:hypothetical protein